MAIVDVASPGSVTSNLGYMDFYPSWGPSRTQTASFLVFDVLPFLIPGGAMFSGIRKAGYLRKLYVAGRGGDKAFDTARVVDKAGDMQVGTTLFASGLLGAATYYGTPMHLRDQAFQTVGERTIMYYRDREARIRAILPTDRVINQLWGQSRGVQGEVLPAARRTAESFFDKDGLQRLSSFKRPRTPIPKWSPTTRSRSNRNAAQHPLAEGPRTRGRSPPSRRAKTITPWCPVHQRRHWCTVTRGKSLKRPRPSLPYGKAQEEILVLQRLQHGDKRRKHEEPGTGPTR